MSNGRRTFGALISQDVVCLVEYVAERVGLRVVKQWVDQRASASIDDALRRLSGLLAANDVQRATLALAVEQFGVFHHVMTIPDAADEILRPIVRREVQRVFGIAEPVVQYARGPMQARRELGGASPRPASRQLFIAGASGETIDALAHAFSDRRIDIQIVTVVPKAIHSLYRVRAGSVEPTAVLVCLDGGPHLSFFLDGQLEVAIDPPIPLEGDRPSVAVMLDQVERGAIYFRQQFRGATATRLLLAARDGEYDEVAAAIQERLGVRVSPLYSGTTSPEAVVAMGAVLESRGQNPLDIYPRPPTVADRLSVFTRRSTLAVSAAAAVAAIAGIWASSQFMTLARVRQETNRLRAAVQNEMPVVTPMREVARRRADHSRQLAFVQQSDGERSSLATTLETVARVAPASVRFDSLRVSRTTTGWSAAIDGQTTGATTAESVRNLDDFFNAVRGSRGVSVPSFDHFDYPAPTTDSTLVVSHGVQLVFRLTFEMARDSLASH